MAGGGLSGCSGCSGYGIAEVDEVVKRSCFCCVVE